MFLAVFGQKETPKETKADDDEGHNGEDDGEVAVRLMTASLQTGVVVGWRHLIVLDQSANSVNNGVQIVLENEKRMKGFFKRLLTAAIEVGFGLAEIDEKAGGGKWSGRIWQSRRDRELLQSR